MNTPRGSEVYFPNAPDMVTGSRLIQKGDTLFVREIHSKTVPLTNSQAKVITVLEGLGVVENVPTGMDFSNAVPIVHELNPGDVFTIDAGVTHRYIPESEGALIVQEQMSEVPVGL